MKRPFKAPVINKRCRRSLLGLLMVCIGFGMFALRRARPIIALEVDRDVLVVPKPDASQTLSPVPHADASQTLAPVPHANAIEEAPTIAPAPVDEDDPPIIYIHPNSIESTIDFDQTRFLDFLNGELRPSESSVFGGSLLYSNYFDVKTVFGRVHKFGLFNARNTDLIIRATRSLLIAHTLLYERPDLLVAGVFLADETRFRFELNLILDRISSNTYPWVDSSSIHRIQLEFISLPPETKSGIVMSVNNAATVPFAVHSIATLRNALNCNLPIEIHYTHSNDLTSETLHVLSQLPNVRTMNLTDLFQQEGPSKPFSVLASGFQNVIFVDPRVLFFQNPEVLFSSPLFLETGQLFYHDRSIQRDFNHEYAAIFRSMNPHMTKYGSSLRFTNSLSYHEQHTGVLVFDKSRTGVIHALFLACELSSPTMRAGRYAFLHDDREIFWMAWEMLRVPYRFSPTYGGAVGVLREDSAVTKMGGKQVCGNLVHVDEELNPLWWNRDILEVNEVVKFEYFAFDDEPDELKWNMEFEGGVHCLQIRESDTAMRELTLDEKEMGSRSVETFAKMMELGFEQFIQSEFK
ncbi:hypothetical protein HDU98_001364 [Podochytrium sp. JEL0797]|nr:hypothetical protein HDU98_001364 [Podochytrium sp. JEL0797]